MIGRGITIAGADGRPYEGTIEKREGDLYIVRLADGSTVYVDRNDVRKAKVKA